MGACFANLHLGHFDQKYISSSTSPFFFLTLYYIRDALTLTQFGKVNLCFFSTLMIIPGACICHIRSLCITCLDVVLTGYPDGRITTKTYIKSMDSDSYLNCHFKRWLSYIPCLTYSSSHTSRKIGIYPLQGWYRQHPMGFKCHIFPHLKHVPLELLSEDTKKRI